MQDHDSLRRYLLGDLPERQREEIQSQWSTDDALVEALQTAENDLIDAYVCQELSEKQRRLFETYFLNSPDRRARLEISQMLMSSSVRSKVSLGLIVKEKPKAAGWRLFHAMPAAVTAALVAVVVIAILLVVQNQRLRNELKLSRAEYLNLQNRAKLQPPAVQGRPAAESQVEHSRLPADLTASLILSPGLLRNGGSNQGKELSLPANASVVVLMLRLESNAFGVPAAIRYSSYDVVLETVEGRKVRTLRGLSSQQAPGGGEMVTARFPAQLLAEGDYLVTLLGYAPGRGLQNLASYSFSVAQ